ncbi:MAG TPA: Gfo/Idh/MocA family oxidoreductase [Cyclobacteriaceae bacterium]|nr:Gfo/Idh/MocA family oxidoreductase [Cyclobacteriaceae bacterium]
MRIINTAILSFGMSGKVFHAPFINMHPGFRLVGCWERNKKLIGDAYPGTKSYPTLDDLLADPGIELVVVNTPSYTHFEYALKVLQAEKHVIVEKPFTANALEALELKKLAEKKGLRLSVFQNRRWDSDFRTVKNIVDQNLLGEIVEATISYDRYNPVLSPKVHKETINPGSGVVKDLGPHIIDQALTLFGMPEGVFGDIRITRPDSIVADYMEILLYYPGMRSRLKSGYFVREPVSSFIIHGKKGTFLKSRADVQEPQLVAGMKPDEKGYGIEPEEQQGFLHTEKDGVVIKEKVKSLPGNYSIYYAGIYEAFVHDKPLPVTADDGVNVMKIIDAAILSSKEKRVVVL